MDSDESGHGESKFYYPEEETLNQMMPINLLPNFKKKKSKKITYKMFCSVVSLSIFTSCAVF